MCSDPTPGTAVPSCTSGSSASASASAAPSGFKYVTTGQPVEDISQEECNTFTYKLDGYSFSVVSEAGNPKGCFLQDGTPPGAKGVYYNTGGTADCGAYNGVSKCVVKDKLGSQCLCKQKKKTFRFKSKA